MTRNSKGQFVKQPIRSESAQRVQYHIVLVALTAAVFGAVAEFHPEVINYLFPGV